MTLCKDIMTTKITTCTPSDTVKLAAQLLKHTNVGSLPAVDNGGKLVGIITDRDITTRVVANDVDPNNMLVATVMTKNPVICHPDDSLEVARGLMSDYQIRRLPIVNEQGQLVGIIAQADLVLRSSENLATEQTIEGISQPFKP